MEEERVPENIHEEIEEKKREIEELYHDVIFDLAVKYEKTIDIGFDMLLAIARAKEAGIDPEYESNIEFDLDELVRLNKELTELSEKTL